MPHSIKRKLTANLVTNDSNSIEVVVQNNKSIAQSFLNWITP